MLVWGDRNYDIAWTDATCTITQESIGAPGPVQP